ncbi:hypothetical protein TSUD_362650 [Trifolium subterraneum]|uniref:Uncharacterized protein n=1 Tax=Trifolium subterraneum TaxID=3900 RepID=A0A2Z6NL35_TRISU|nr:hypothetical protein TSUD_362650 [Trifolium subterraneum]
MNGMDFDRTVIKGSVSFLRMTIVLASSLLIDVRIQGPVDSAIVTVTLRQGLIRSQLGHTIATITRVIIVVMGGQLPGVWSKEIVHDCNNGVPTQQTSSLRSTDASALRKKASTLPCKNSQDWNHWMALHGDESQVQKDVQQMGENIGVKCSNSFQAIARPKRCGSGKGAGSKK